MSRCHVRPFEGDPGCSVLPHEVVVSAECQYEAVFKTLQFMLVSTGKAHDYTPTFVHTYFVKLC